VDLRAALDAAAIEYLDVDEHRTVVIYQQAILMVIATDGQASAARSFDVELWEEPAHDPNRDPEALLTSFLDDMLATTDATHQ
jgi:hypothetical protein